MSHAEERAVVEKWHRRTSMLPGEKREAIAETSRLESRLRHFSPSYAATRLADLWAGRRRLDWGCAPVVSR
jgi:hypothetical protein